MSKKTRVHSGDATPAELRGKIVTDGGAEQGTFLTSAATDQAVKGDGMAPPIPEVGVPAGGI